MLTSAVAMPRQRALGGIECHHARAGALLVVLVVVAVAAPELSVSRVPCWILDGAVYSLVVAATALVLGLILVVARLAVVAAASKLGRDPDNDGGGGGVGSHCDS